MENTIKNKIFLEDRYSGKIFECHKSTIFIVGGKIATIRKSNNSCVDIRGENNELLNWWALEYVLKNPETFVAIVICQDIGNVKTQLKIIARPFQFVKANYFL